MKRILYPNDYVRSVYAIDFEILAAQGYNGIIFDVDNTLVLHGAPADKRAVALFATLHELGYHCICLSNNKEKRVRTFCETVRYADYIYKAGKPNPRGYYEAVRRMNTDKTKTLVIGDQIFTDIIGGNLAGIRTILVKPVQKWNEEIQIVFKRFLEAIVLWGYALYKHYGDQIEPVPMKREEEK